MRDTDKRTAKDKEITRISVGARLGDEARAYRIPGTSGVVIYAVVWRYRNVKALVLVAGTPSSGATSSAATRLAAKQQRRIKASF